MNQDDWVKITVEPPKNVSLLVRMFLVGPVYDVAIYKGIMPDGERRWVMGDVNLNQSLITHWALISEPEIPLDPDTQ